MPRKTDYRVGETIIHWTHLQHLPKGTVLISLCDIPQAAILRTIPGMGTYWEVTGHLTMVKHHKLHDTMKCPDLIVSYLPEGSK